MQLSRLGRAGAAFFIAWRNLTGERRRWLISAAALGVAACLVFFLEGVSSWITDSATAYVDHSGATLVVAEKGIDDLLFAQSSMPATATASLRRLAGVRSADPVVTINGLLSIRGSHLPVFVVGFDGRAAGPWQLASGSARVAQGSIVVDRGFAAITGLRVGDTMALFSHRLTVSGIADGANAAGDFFLFVPLRVAQAIAGQGDAISYVFVRTVPGTDISGPAHAIDRIPGVHALSRTQLAANDRAAIVDSFDRPLQIIVLVALIVGVLIAAIVLYTATVEHTRDYAVLKAIGSSSSVMYGSAVAQCLVLTLCGLGLGLAVAEMLAFVFATWQPVIEAQLDPSLILGVALIVLAANLCAALLPIRRLHRVDPQEVFKA